MLRSFIGQSVSGTYKTYSRYQDDISVLLSDLPVFMEFRQFDCTNKTSRAMVRTNETCLSRCQPMKLDVPWCEPLKLDVLWRETMKLALPFCEPMKLDLPWCDPSLETGLSRRLESKVAVLGNDVTLRLF